MIIGYTRVSTKGQDDALQLDALNRYGVDRIYRDTISGVKQKEELKKALEILRSGDTLVLWRLDRLGRTTKELLELVEWFSKENINFVSLQENLDTTTPMGKFSITVLCALSAMERDILITRVKAGLESARERGVIGGRPKTDKKLVDKALKLYESKTHSIKEITEITKVSPSVLYRAINKQKKDNNNN